MAYIDLRRLREDNGRISQAQLAEKLGFTQPFISQIEDGKRRPNSQLLDALREMYGDIDCYITDEPAAKKRVYQHNENGNNINGDTVLVGGTCDEASVEIIKLRAELDAKEKEIQWLRSLVEKLSLQKQ